MENELRKKVGKNDRKKKWKEWSKNNKINDKVNEGPIQIKMTMKVKVKIKNNNKMRDMN